MDIWIGKIIGQIGPDAWVQVHDFTPLEEDKLRLRGRLVAIVGFQNIPDGQTVAQGREILARLNELYYGQLETDALTELKLAVNSVKAEFDGQQEKLECICLVIVDQVVHVVRSVGGVWAQLLDKEGWLISPDSPEETQSLTGELQPGLTIVVGNPKFWQGMSLGVVKASLKNDDPRLILDTLGAVVQGNTKLQNAVGAVVRVSSPPTPVVQPSVAKSKFQLPVWLKKVPQIYLANPADMAKRRRTMMAGVGFLVLLLILVGGWQFRKQQESKATSAQNMQLEALLYKYREASALAQLNPARSRQLLSEVEPEMQRLKENSGKNKDPRLLEIESGLPQVLGAATGTKSPEAQLVLDLGLLRADLVGSSLRLLDDQSLAVLDTKVSRLVLIDPTKKKGEVVAGQDSLGIARAMAVYPGKIEIVSDKGVVECSVTSVQCSVKIPPDDKMPGLVDMGMFGGNIYLLDRQALWRYQVTDTGFGSVQNWLAEEEKPDFGTAQSMTIDGSIWVGKTGGVIEKYVRGVKDSFAIANLDQPLGQRIGLYTDEILEKLYIWDGDNGRIVAVIKNSGEFDSQYKLPQISETVGFVVDERAGILYLLTGSKLWQAKL